MIQITDSCRGYDSEQERDTDIEQLKKQGFNYFVKYRDTQAGIALQYGRRVVNSTDEKLLRQYKRQDTGWMVRHPGYDLLC